MSIYLPAQFQLEDRSLLLAFMQAHHFAQLLVVDGEGEPWVSHLPLVVKNQGELGVIEGHFAAANPQGRVLAERGRALLIFSGPHGYVSPALYDTSPAVPTWNYAAVHAAGRLELIHDPEQKDRQLKELIAIHEPAYAEQWRGFAADYQQRMLKGIVGFRLVVDKLEGKFKLGQNRSPGERQRIHAALAGGDPSQQSLADWMGRLGLLS